MDNIVTVDFSRFGARELIIASKLLEIYAEEGADFLGDNVSVSFNIYSGYVFLTDEDYNVGLLDNEERHILQFFYCSECGYESTQEDALVEGKDFFKYEGFCSFECFKKNR